MMMMMRMTAAAAPRLNQLMFPEDETEESAHTAKQIFL